MQNLLKYWLATVVVIFGTINSAYADLNDGLVACYGFEENANDTSDNALHGTEHGGVSYTTGRIGKAASFDGVDDYIEVAHNNALNPAQLSVAVWMNVFDVSQVTASHNHHMVFNKESQYEMAAFGEPYGDAQTNELSFAFNPHWHWKSSGFFPNLDTFYHVVLMFNENNKARLYIDGQFVKEISYSGPIIPRSNCLRIGARGCPATASAFFNGLIDEMHIYNRVLSDSEIESLYRGEHVCDIIPNAIELDEFRAIKSPNGVSVRWKTRTEQDSEKFVLWKGQPLNGICTDNLSNYSNPVPLIEVSARGENDQGSDYPYENGLPYLDQDGDSRFCYGLQEIGSDGNWNLYVTEVKIN
jgi:hypothetical protein